MEAEYLKVDKSAVKNTDETYDIEDKMIKTSTGDKPILPVRIKPGVNVAQSAAGTTNLRFYRPAELWEAMGVANPPKYTKRNGQGVFIPWPKFGDTARKIGDNLCAVTDLEKLRVLNAHRMPLRLEAADRAQVIADGSDIDVGNLLSRPVADLEAVTPTVPLQVKTTASVKRTLPTDVDDGQIWVSEDFLDKNKIARLETLRASA